MSFEQRPSARHEGWDGPFYPPGLEQLNSIHQAGTLTPEAMEEMKQKARVVSWIGRIRPTTSDGYQWWTGHLFLMAEGYVAVFFPPRESDESIAVYRQGPVPDETVQRLLQRISSALEAMESEANV